MATPTDLISDSIEEKGQNGSFVVGTSPVQFGPKTPFRSGVLLRTPSTNSNNVYVGFNSDVTADSDGDTDGMIIEPGGELPVPTRLLSHLYVIGGAASQKVFWFAQ